MSIHRERFENKSFAKKEDQRAKQQCQTLALAALNPSLSLSLKEKQQHTALPRRRPGPFPLLHPLAMQAVLQVLLKVLDHAERQRRVHLAGAVVAADARQVHHPAAFGGA